MDFMKSLKLSFDLTDEPQLVELLRMHAAKEGRSLKAVLVEALKSFFSHKQESALILKAAEKAFSEWDNEEDGVYDTL